MPDFVIIGGGIYGCTVAWALAKQGAEVYLLEAKTIASGASGGLGKRGVRANGRDIRELPLMAMAYEQWPSLHEEIGGETGYERLGHLLLMEREQDLVAASARSWVQTQKGIPTRQIEAAELRDMEPFLAEQVLGALFCPRDGVADHTQTTRSMARAAERHGAVIQENAQVTGLERRGDKIVAVLAMIDNAEVRISVRQQLILLSNYHTLPFVQQTLGVTLPLWPLLPQVMRTESLAEMPVKHLIGHASRTLAIKPIPDKQVMISGGWRGTWNETLGRGETIPTQVEGNRAEAVAVYPALAEVPIVEATADRIELISADGIPIIDYLPGATNMLVGAGWSGHGWAIAPAVGQLMVDWVLSSKKPNLLEPFRYNRF